MKSGRVRQRKEVREVEDLYCGRRLLSLCGRRSIRLDPQHDPQFSEY